MTMVSAPAIHLEGVVKTFPNPLDAARPIHAVAFWVWARPSASTI